ncbi:MAG: hypothetical protein O7H39_01855, partial [Gammaproteobacteria bacterium]|nr:hypothetical protein [Gammaproteobacteria bacterium]
MPSEYEHAVHKLGDLVAARSTVEGEDTDRTEVVVDRVLRENSHLHSRIERIAPTSSVMKRVA